MTKMLSKSILNLGKCPNRKTHESESACFLVWALRKVQNRIWKQFSHKVLYNYYSKFFLERFGLYLTKSKNGFPIVFSNLARKGSRGFFELGSNLFCQMAWIYLLNSCGGPQSSDFVITIYSYPLLLVELQR